MKKNWSKINNYKKPSQQTEHLGLEIMHYLLSIVGDHYNKLYTAS